MVLQNSIRKGRGVGSGFGKTAGRGHKGRKQDLEEVKALILKVGKHLYKEDCPNMGLQIFLRKNM